MASGKLLSILMCFLFVLSAAVPALSKTASVIAPDCNHDNCLRQFIQNARSITTFCAAYTSSASASLPTFVSQCTSDASRLSSACSCMGVTAKLPSSTITIAGTPSAANSTMASVSSSQITSALDASIKMAIATVPVSQTATTAELDPTALSIAAGAQSTTNSPNSLASVQPTLTTSSVPAIVSKAGQNRADPDDCNFEGLPTTNLLNNTLTTLYSSTTLACQTPCENYEGAGPCLSYSWQAPANPTFANCQLFSVAFTGTADDGTNFVIKDIESGIFFSNRWPADGSGFCYYIVS